MNEQVFRFRPPSEEIERSVDAFMSESGKQGLDVYLSARAICSGPTHRGFFRRGYDKRQDFGSVISNGKQLIASMISAANEVYKSHKKSSPHCEVKPDITVTASIEGLESSTLQF